MYSIDCRIIWKGDTVRVRVRFFFVVVIYHLWSVDTIVNWIFSFYLVGFICIYVKINMILKASIGIHRPPSEYNPRINPFSAVEIILSRMWHASRLLSMTGMTSGCRQRKMNKSRAFSLGPQWKKRKDLHCDADSTNLQLEIRRFFSSPKTHVCNSASSNSGGGVSGNSAKALTWIWNMPQFVPTVVRCYRRTNCAGNSHVGFLNAPHGRYLCARHKIPFIE